MYDDSVCVHAESVEGNNTEYFDVRKYLLSNNNDNRTEMLAADVSQLGSLAVNLRVMVKLTARQIYKTSVLWAKYAVRMIAEYMQHQSFIRMVIIFLIIMISKYTSYSSQSNNYY